MRFQWAHIRQEAVAGMTTFFTMAYILIVNPAILSTEGTGLPFSGVATATVLVCFTMTLLMGLYAKLPFAIGPGMGINAFVAFTIILGENVPWPVAFGMVFWSGLVFVLISLTPIRKNLALEIPHNLRIASAAGIGIFLTFIGLKNAGVVIADPVTFVRFGGLQATTYLCFTGIALIIVFLHFKKSYAFIASLAIVTGLGWLLGLGKLPSQFVAAPDFKSVFFQLDIWGALKISFIPTIVSLVFTDLFDSISTFVGVSHANNMLDEDGHPLRLQEGLAVDAVATMSSGLFGSSSGTTFIESSAGIEAGGRTGLTSVFTALCFLPCFFLSPLTGVVPAFATAPILIVVGALMFRVVGEIKTDELHTLVPAYLTLILIPLTFSITQGILWGLLTHAALSLLLGKTENLNPYSLGLGILSAILLAIETM